MKPPIPYSRAAAGVQFLLILGAVASVGHVREAPRPLAHAFQFQHAN